MGTFYKEITDSYLPSSITDQGFRKLVRPKSNQSRSIARVTNRADNKEINDLYVEVLNDFNNPAKPDFTTAVEYCTLVNIGFSKKGDFDFLFDQYKEESEGGKTNFFPPSIDYTKNANTPIKNVVLDAFYNYNYPPKATYSYLDLGSEGSFQNRLIDAINPAVTIPIRVNRQINFKLHNSGIAAVGEAVGATTSTGADDTILKPIQAAPKFEKAAYQHLKGISSDFILPGIDQVQDNTISLVVTNPEFIQSYMVGLNHEMSRELLWREYPTDQRGTYFSKFWDATDYDPDKIEGRVDIKPIHKWDGDVPIGDATHDPNTTKGETVVLLIRGELLRKFPNIVIYAQKAKIRDGEDKIREFNDDSGSIVWPIFQATVEPDVYFIGFDLTEDEVIGNDGINGVDADGGYYFVLRERPGEIQFGSDIEADESNTATTVNDWDNLSWEDIPLANGFIDVSSLGISYNAGNPDGNNVEEEEKAVALTANTNSAEMAYALYQAPALVAIHASKMLNTK